MNYSWSNSLSFHPTKSKESFGYNLLLFSHIVNLFPIALVLISYRLEFFLFLIILVVQTLTSFFYHLFPNNIVFRILDWIFAILLIAFNISIFLSLPSSILFFRLMFLIPILILGLFCFFKFTDYYKYHTLWHICAAATTFIILL